MLRILKLCGFDGSGECFEEASAFAARCGISVRTLTDVLRNLEAKQLVTIQRRVKRLNRISLTDKTKEMINPGKICRHKENNTLYMSAEFADEKSEIERIHMKWLKNTDKGT